MTDRQVKVFIVGGYVRDRLLGREGKDHDYVVVGADHEWMINANFAQVGADFPVYLHHESGDEYALARKERKVAAGYHGFETDFGPEVTLEEDLFRRDLTINAMAREVISWNELGHAKLKDEIFDPFNGQEDLKNRILRHVSEHFAEDPVRVLRLARFWARYEGFSIHPSTVELAKQMVKDGELDHLVPERVWTETCKAIMEPDAWKYFEFLIRVGALEKVMPHLKLTAGPVVKPFKSIVDVDAPMVLRFAILTAFMDPEDCAAFYDELKAPSDVRDFAVKVNWLRPILEKGVTVGDKSSGEVVIDLLERLGNGHNRENIIEMLHNTVSHINPKFDHEVFILRTVNDYTKGISFAELNEDEQKNLKGPEIGQAIKTLRCSIANKVLFKLF